MCIGVLMHVALVVRRDIPLRDVREKQTPVPRPYLGPGQSVVVRRLGGFVCFYYVPS